MKKILFSFLIGIMITSIVAETALGDIYNTNRQYGSVSSLTELQEDVFDDIGATSISAYGDQSMFAIYKPMAGGSSASTYVATISYFFDGVEFGIYEYGNTSNKLMLFDGSSGYPTLGSTVNIDFNTGTNTVKSYDTGGTIDTATYFDNFGFYAYRVDDTSPGGPFYSEDSLNTGGYARFLIYEGEGDTVTVPNKTPGSDEDHWYVATEAGNYGSASTSGADFTDFVVLMESIVPVPVPAAVLLGILGLGVVGLKLRKYA